MTRAILSLTAACVALGPIAAAAEGELNLYSSRHYDTDERLYSDFTEATGITINRIEGKADELIARMEAEGANSPADILLTVDTSRLERAKQAGVLQSIDSDVLEARLPSYLQDADNQWFGFSQRARILFYDKNEVTDPPSSYAELAEQHRLPIGTVMSRVARARAQLRKEFDLPVTAPVTELLRKAH